MSLSKSRPGVVVGYGVRSVQHEGPFAFSSEVRTKLASELTQAMEPCGDCSHHVVDFAIEALRQRIENYREWVSAMQGCQTDAEARKVLRRASTLATDLATLLSKLDMRAAAYLRDQLVSLLPVSVADLTAYALKVAEAADKAAGAVPVQAGRTGAAVSLDRLVEHIAGAVTHCRIDATEGGQFLRICTLVYQVAGVPSSNPRDAIRKLREKWRLTG